MIPQSEELPAKRGLCTVERRTNFGELGENFEAPTMLIVHPVHPA